jgi:uncharacterized protein
MKFVNREQELARLERWWAGSERLALVWGRRRAGKTALIRRFAEGRRVVFHTGGGESAVEELAELSRRAREAFPDDIRDLTSAPYLNWHDALDHLARLSAGTPTLLVLDEFPELLTGSPALPGILRAFWDDVGDRTKLRILLCGSAVRTMFSIQESRAPLYGRFDLVLLVHPFRPHEAAAMLPKLRPADRALVYGLIGGMPLYLSWWDQEASVEENLLDLACRPDGRLLTEGRLVLATEAGEGEQPAAVLRAVARGRTKFSEIADLIGANPARTLERLIELRLIERILPVTEDEHSRRRMYRVSDNFLAFYLGPLMRYRTEIERDLGPAIVPALIAALDDYMGRPYEEAFRDHLRRLARAGLLGEGIVAIGPWWKADSEEEIDAVVLAEHNRARRPVLVGEAKWGRSIDGARIRAQLMRKVGILPDADPEQLRYAVCAREAVMNSAGICAMWSFALLGNRKLLCWEESCLTC